MVVFCQFLVQISIIILCRNLHYCCCQTSIHCF